MLLHLHCLRSLLFCDDLLLVMSNWLGQALQNHILVIKSRVVMYDFILQLLLQ